LGKVSSAHDNSFKIYGYCFNLNGNLDFHSIFDRILNNLENITDLLNQVFTLFRNLRAQLRVKVLLHNLSRGLP